MSRPLQATSQGFRTSILPQGRSVNVQAPRSSGAPTDATPLARPRTTSPSHQATKGHRWHESSIRSSRCGSDTRYRHAFSSRSRSLRECSRSAPRGRSRRSAPPPRRRCPRAAVERAPHPGARRAPRRAARPARHRRLRAPGPASPPRRYPRARRFRRPATPARTNRPHAPPRREPRPLPAQPLRPAARP